MTSLHQKDYIYPDKNKYLAVMKWSLEYMK